MSIDLRGKERNVRLGIGQVNQAKGPSAKARQARGPSTTASKAISLHLKSMPKIYAQNQQPREREGREREREKEREQMRSSKTSS